MKKLLVSIGIACLFVFSCFADVTNTGDDTAKHRLVNGWHLFVYDDDIDVDSELITDLDTTYAQLAAADYINVIPQAATSADVVVYGINAAGKRIQDTISLSVATYSTSTSVFTYIDQIYCTGGAPDLLKVQRSTGGTFINSISTGNIVSPVAQHFNGTKKSYITAWGGNLVTGDVVHFQLRWYPDDADCLDATDDWLYLDRITLINGDTYPNEFFRVYPGAIECPAGGWIAVYASSSTVNAVVTTTLQGFDM